MPSRRDAFLHRFERVIINALLVHLAVVTLAGTVMLFVLLARNFQVALGSVTDAETLQSTIQRAFGGVLGVLIGLELLETVRQYSVGHHVRVQVVFFVALIALGRHIIQTDYRHAPPLELFGMAALIVGLGLSLLLVNRSSERERTDGGSAN